jgi:hypothetical protein
LQDLCFGDFQHRFPQFPFPQTVKHLMHSTIALCEFLWAHVKVLINADSKRDAHAEKTHLDHCFAVELVRCW